MEQRRKSTRLAEYDYSLAGMYFVTVCTQDRVCLFGNVMEDEVRLNRFGEIVRAAWDDLPNHHSQVKSDALVVMPNHIHGIVAISVGARPASPSGAADASAGRDRAPGPRPGSLGSVIGSFKSSVARQINALRATPGGPVWQRNYHEHVIRNDDDLRRARQYITENPLKWHLDRENPDWTRG